MARKRLATDFEGTTNPGDDPSTSGLLANNTGAMSGILRTGGGLSGTAGDVRAYVGDPPSSLAYRSRSYAPDLVADVAGAEVWFRPREGTPSGTGGDMPGVRALMLWQDGDRNATLSVNLTGDLEPGPMYEANVETSYNDGDVEEFTTVDLTGHDWFGWHRLAWRPTGAWEVATAGGSVLASGSLTPIPRDYADPTGEGLRVQVEADLFYTGGGGEGTFNGAGALVDDLYVWLRGGPATRIYPRDDSRGISGPARVWPPPKSNRLIGGCP